MPEMPNVLATETILATWGNQIRDRTIQRYASASARAAGHPSPAGGDLSYLADTGELALYHSGSWRGFVPAGAIIPFGGAVSPAGWLLCNGAEISRSTYAGLFAAIGTTYGAGDGSTTFGLPDLRQRFPLGVGPAGTGSTLGETGGALDHAHTGPSHTHTGPSHTHTGPSHTHDLGATVSGGGGGATSTSAAHSHGTPGATTSSDSHSHTMSDTTGGPSSTSAEWNNGSVFSGASTSHTHSFSGSTGSDSHSHTVPAGTSGSAAGHSHTIPNHAHDLGVSAASGTAATGASGTAATGAAGNGPTGIANPPFLAIHYLIKI